MGATSSSRSARRLLRGRLCSLCPSRGAAGGAKGAEAGGTAAAAHQDDAVIVMPLDNPPDVIGAHERYYSPGGYPYGLDGLAGSLPGRTLARTLPTQHQHPPWPPRQDRQHDAGRTTARTCSTTTPSSRSRTEARSGSSSPPSRQPHSHSRRHRHHRGRSSKPSSGCSRSRPSARSPRHSRAAQSRACFGYDIEDVDGFLAKASIQSPANIPMVLAAACTLYRTREGGWQEEVPLPLGMVVNGVFRASGWLYAQTPHGHEGYVRYTSCLPLGIIPPQRAEAADEAPTRVAEVRAAAAAASSSSPSPRGAGQRPGPCWDTASDIFPYPALCSGNRTDTDKIGDTRSESAYSSRRPAAAAGRGRRALNLEHLLEARRAEQRVDALYIQACTGGSAVWAASTTASSRPGTLVVVQRTYTGFGLSLARGDVVAILENEDSGWLRVQDRHGREGLVPASITDSGYL
ncbi:uncharacterized protein LOC113214648 [Frankliniella occidentalis]|uniref:Uncharacterized protein LOC113214648 n=1 Tax=Frankliniella occidentalis TaxID=133901 RepID=A0A6J1TDT1_FRAOC|nr:uncharacterized protein LOC113214648 [Frankliniella occidentalis]XP_052128908.1 uncharacterized protein LOC113214648 [Frankliniella occidentalis]